MAHETEAACLLKSGTMYDRRLGLSPPDGDPVFAGLKSGAFSLYWGDEPIVHFDLEGRWQRAYVEGTHYLKGLDTTTQTIERVREDALVLRRRTLGFTESTDFDSRIRALVLDIAAGLDAGSFEQVRPPQGVELLSAEELRTLLDRASAWDSAAWFAHRERYVAAYGHGTLPFLPPDCPHAVVLLATLGNAIGRSFGGAMSPGYVARSPRDFEDHARQIDRLLGARILQCRNIFIGGSDALLQPSAVVDAYLEAAARLFPILPGPRTENNPAAGRIRRRGNEPTLDGIHAFLEDFNHPASCSTDWLRWSALGLRRVTLGVESGNRGVRALYGKHWAEDDLRRTVRAIKMAGVGVGLAVLVGAGGIQHSDEHVSSTVELIESLDLGAGDLVSLLDARELLDGEANGAGHGIDDPLSGPAWQEQRAAFKDRLAPFRTGRKVKVVPYSLEKQGIA